MKRVLVLVLLLMAGIPGVASVTPAQAGTGSSDCTNRNWSQWGYNIITTPITLGLRFTDPNNALYPGTSVELCYSTSPVGHSGADTTGGSIEVVLADAWDIHGGDEFNAQCVPQSNSSGVVTSCYAGTTPAVWTNYGTPDRWATSASVAFAIPITVCVGSCTTVTPSHGAGLGTTGVIVGVLPYPAGAPAGTDRGIGAVVPAMSFCVDGTCTPIVASDTYVGAGQVCRDYDPTCDSPWPFDPTWVRKGTLAVVQIGSTVIPVDSPVGVCTNHVYDGFRTATGGTPWGYCPYTVDP